MVQSEGENADKIRLHLFYWGNVRRFFNHEKEIGCARRSGIHCRHSSQRMRRFQGRRHEKQLCRLETGKRRKIIVAYKAGSGTDTGARLLANSARSMSARPWSSKTNPGLTEKSAGRNSPRPNRTDTP
ncbi:MAG: hypothetical protein ACLUIQ_08320 [Dialister invisus]